MDYRTLVKAMKMLGERIFRPVVRAVRLVVVGTESWANSILQSCEDTGVGQQYPSDDDRASEISL